MIDEKDLNIYIKAKKQLKVERIFFTFCILGLLVWATCLSMGIEKQYLDMIAGACFLGAVLSQSLVGPIYGSMYIQRSALLDVIERQINKDSMALQYVLDKNT